MIVFFYCTECVAYRFRLLHGQVNNFQVNCLLLAVIPSNCWNVLLEEKGNSLFLKKKKINAILLDWVEKLQESMSEWVTMWVWRLELLTQENKMISYLSRMAVFQIEKCFVCNSAKCSHTARLLRMRFKVHSYISSESSNNKIERGIRVKWRIWCAV